MLRCFILDDERPAINVLKRYINRMPDLLLVGTETNPIAGIELIQREKPDVVFLDIQMEEMSGLDVMNVIGQETKVVFCTAYSEFAVTSYELDAVDYLMKPIEFRRFVKAVERVTAAVVHNVPVTDESIPNDYIYVKTGIKGKLLKIDFDEIDYIEGRNNYVAFFRGNKPAIVAYLTLKELETKLAGKQFMRVHKSYIVALKQISSLENNQLHIKNSMYRVPIGANFKEAFMERMKDKIVH